MISGTTNNHRRASFLRSQQELARKAAAPFGPNARRLVDDHRDHRDRYSEFIGRIARSNPHNR